MIDFKFINSSTPDEERPPLWRRGDATILASCRGATGQKDWRPDLPGPRKFARGSIFDDDGSDPGWRDDHDPLSAGERAHYERVAGMSAADIFKRLTGGR